MNDQQTPDRNEADEAMEARIVAWVLGEASAFEATELERLCGEDPAAREFHRRMLHVHRALEATKSVSEEVSWKLPAGKRAALETVLGGAVAEVKETARSARRSGWRSFYAIAACVILTLTMIGLFAPMFHLRQGKSPSSIMAYEAAETEALTTRFEAPGEPAGGAPGAMMSEAVAANAPQDVPMQWKDGGALSDLAEDSPKAREMAVPLTLGRTNLRLNELADTAEGETLHFQSRTSRKGPVATEAEVQRFVDELDGIKATADMMETVLEDPEFLPSEIALSTFSLNVSDASFQMAAAALDSGGRPEPTMIKTEQFYNAVDYGDPAPVGGEPVAGTVEQSAHPVLPGRNLVRIGLKTAAAGRGAGQPLRLTLMVDQSGSMVREDRREALREAAEQLAGLMGEGDLVNVIGFSRTPRLLGEGLRGDLNERLVGLMSEPASEGGTNLEEALKLAREVALRHYDARAQNRVVLFTDGATNLGDADPESLAETVVQMRQEGLALDVTGVGIDGLNDRLLSELARNGNGRYQVLSTGSDLAERQRFASQLAGAFRPAAEDVKVQVSFNPERVSRYQLIGFQEDLLRPEDFLNDAVDAAEMAAEEAGVAMYQVEVNPEGSGDVGSVSVRFRDAASGETIERSWVIPHDPSAPAFDLATPAMQLAGLSMLAAEKLRGGAMAEAIDFNQLAEVREKVRANFSHSRQVARMLGVIEAID